MISINFILRKLFLSMSMPFDMIPITKSKKTLKIYYEFGTKSCHQKVMKFTESSTNEFFVVFFDIMADSWTLINHYIIKHFESC